jgi:selenium metabolism protein YedF
MKTIDAKGQPCPLPVIAAKKALKEAKAGQKIAIVVDNDVAVQNLEKMAKALGHVATAKAKGEAFEVTIVIGEKIESEALAGGLVVAVSQSQLGSGDEKLGKNLLKAFLFSLTETEPTPEYVLFFNGGAFLTCEGSDSLKDLADLAAKGAVIGTCGACLDYYGLKDKLKVGAVTNMYAIVTTLSQAKRLINV